MREGDTETLAGTLFTHARQQTFRKNQVIIQAEENPLGIYYITDGWVRGVSPCENGDVNIVQTYFAHDIFPLPWILTNTLPNVTFIANTETNVLRLSYTHFMEELTQSPDLSLEILRFLAQQKLTMAEEYAFLQYKSARLRVIYRLLALAHKFGHASGPAVALTTPVTNEYIARSTHMTRETASREVNRLIRTGHISHQNGQYVIQDYAALKSLLLAS
jgi:CRP/FNR family transcriptional regulator, cyclic AMP receptor protein